MAFTKEVLDENLLASSATASDTQGFHVWVFCFWFSVDPL